MNNDLLRFYFLADGRCSRRDYWLKFLLPVGGLVLILALTRFPGAWNRVVVNLFALLILLPLLWINGAVTARRWHDVGWSGWWAALNFVPGLNCIAPFVAGVIPGVEDL